MKIRFAGVLLAVILSASLFSPAAAMKASDIPVKFQVPFGNSATGSFIRTVPLTSSDPCAASDTLGFPPNTFQPIGAGGCPPDGRDFNGILNQTTAWSRWLNAAGPVAYDAVFSAAINGYPKGTVLTSATFGQFWISTADDNTSDPDTGGANWIGFTALNLYAADTGTTNAYVAAFVPNYSSPIDGVTVTVKIANSNTTTSTLNGITIVRRDGSALIGNELAVGQDAKFTYVSASNRYQLIGVAPASNAITAAGTDAQSAVSPAGLASLFTSSKGTRGYQKLAGGLILQWGAETPQAPNSTVTYSFPLAFPNTALIIVASWGATLNLPASAIGADAISASQFNLTNSNASGSALGPRWIAIGF